MFINGKKLKLDINYIKYKEELKMRKRLILVLSLAMIVTMVGCSSGVDDANGDNQEEVVANEEVEEVEDEPELEAEEVIEKSEVEEVSEEIPREHKAALKKAEFYANDMHMSKLGVYDQLVSEHGENFPTEAAQYAVDNLQVDWKVGALKKAEFYANEMSMSNAAVYDQLVSEHGEQFTPEEAQYAVDNLE